MRRKECIDAMEFFIRMAHKRIGIDDLQCLEYFEKANGALLAYNFVHKKTMSLYDISEEYHSMIHEITDMVEKVRQHFYESVNNNGGRLH